MTESRKDVDKGGDGKTGVRIVLNLSGSGSHDVRVGVLGNVRYDDAGNGAIPSGVPKEHHWKADKAAGRRDLGDTENGGGPKGGR